MKQHLIIQTKFVKEGCSFSVDQFSIKVSFERNRVCKTFFEEHAFVGTIEPLQMSLSKNFYLMEPVFMQTRTLVVYIANPKL